MSTLRVYLVDDEPLAVERLQRLLSDVPEIVIAGSTTDPAAAVEFLSREKVDVVFLDIQMPGMNGFELLGRLAQQPFVIFTTAYDQYALKAFEVNSIDYLLKPIDPEQMRRALGKIERLRGQAKPAWMQSPDFDALLRQLANSLAAPVPKYPERIASRVGERVHLWNSTRSRTSWPRTSLPMRSPAATAIQSTTPSPSSSASSIRSASSVFIAPSC